MPLTIRRIEAADRDGWAGLYAQYAAFYAVEQTDAMRDRVWGWIMDPDPQVQALVADRDGTLIGLAHFRAYVRPLMAARGGFLDDLFVAPDARGAGVAEALIAGVAEAGREIGWTLIRWITAEDNARARALYDRVAAKTPWVTYEVRL